MIQSVPLKPGYCVKLISDRDGWNSRHQCPRKATVQRDGKGYCRQHDPEAVKARSDESMAKWNAKWERDKHEHNRRTLETRVCADVSDDDLRRLAEAGGLAALLAEANGTDLLPKR